MVMDLTFTAEQQRFRAEGRGFCGGVDIKEM